MSDQPHKQVIEAALYVAAEPLNLENLKQLVDISADQVKAIIAELQEEYQNRGVELVKVASGFRFQARQEYAVWLKQLYENTSPRYSRALLETLALIAYRQPITRAEIEDIRGVAVNTKIMRTLQEREWIKVVGFRDVVGKPAIFGTTKQFLDYFNLTSLSDLPPLEEIMDLDKAEKQLQEQLSLMSQQIETDEASTENNSEAGSEDDAAIIDENSEMVIEDNSEIVNENSEVVSENNQELSPEQS